MNSIEITMSEKTWSGLLMHLNETVDIIPVSVLDPDPWQCVRIAIAKIEKAFNDN